MASVLPPLFSILLLLPLLTFSVAQTYPNVSLNSNLTALDENSSWPSPSGEFAFGFRQLENKDLFLLAIWFDKIPQKTIVWYANGDNPAPRGSKVELTTDGRLMLNDPQGKEIWKAMSISGEVSYAAMLDDGNFVLVRRNSEYIWESFKNPADTILPTQMLEVGGMLSSRQREANFYKGRFQLRLLPDGNLVLYTIALPTDFPYAAYYISNTFETDQNDSGYRVVFNESGYLYIVRRNGSIFNLTPGNVVPIGDFYYRATLNFNGVFTQYSYPRTSNNGNKSWSIVSSIPDNICANIGGGRGSGACGDNSYCIPNWDLMPTCECPMDYSFVDPNDQLSDCKPDFIQGCAKDEPGSPEDLFDFQVLQGTDWPTSSYEKLEFYNEEKCKISCLHDCHCAVAIFRGGTCWKKQLPLSHGIVNRNDTGKALIKIRKTDIPWQNQPRPPVSDTKKKDQGTLILVGSVLLGSSVFFNFLLLAAISLVVFFMYHRKLRRDCKVTSDLETNLRSFTYKELEEATDGFKEELGRGAFGIVFKGAIEMGSCNFVAVKKLDKVQENEKEFKTEVSVIGQTHHRNLVRLLGFCDEGQHRLLVYEFMNNGDLAKFLFGTLRPDWTLRTKIPIGIAKGLLYLHEECSSQIIHCDIKPHNILLDDYFIPRISDFGLAKLLLTDQSRTRTAIRGTKGYVAAEWFRNMPITSKVDVYSFGVMLLEIICCRKSVDVEMGGEERAIVTDWAYDCYREGNLDALVENDIEALSDMRGLERLVKVAIWCIQEEPSLRPTMKNVTQMLEGVVEVPVPPCPCPFSYFSATINVPK